MKNQLLIFIAFLAISSVNLTIAADSITMNIEDFHALEVSGNIRVEIYPSDSSYAELYLTNITQDKIVTSVKNSKFGIRMSTGTTKDAHVRVKLYYKKLNDISVSGSALVISDRTLKAEVVKFSAITGGKIDLELELNSLVANAGSGALISFTGEVQKQNVTVNTGATYSAYDLEASESYVKTSSGGKAKLVARKIIDATANSKGFIGYKGDPTTSYIKTNFGGEIANYKDEEE